MSKENRSVWGSWSLVAMFVGAMVLEPQVVNAQGYPVIDSAAVEKAADNLNAAAQQVRELNEMLTQVTSIMQTVGKGGIPALPFQESLTQSGISQYGPPVKDLLDSTQTIWGTAQDSYKTAQQSANSFADILAQADKLKGQANTLASKPDFSSFTSTQNWVKSELTVAKDANLTTVDLTRRARSMLSGEAAANAYAIALTSRSQISGLADRAQKLAQQASSSNDLRGDMAANTAVMLAMHDEMAQVQALLAAILEVQSSARLADLDPASSSTSATGGGTSAASSN
jgi:hypothetical protein